MEAELASLRQQADGTVRIAAIYSVGLSEMSRIEQRFAERFPQAEMDVQYLRPERVWEAVVNDEADLGLISYAESSRDVIAIPWRDEEMVVAVAPENPLSMRHAVSASALQGANFVGFDDDLPIQQRIDRYLKDHKVEVDMVLRFDNIEMIKQAVAHGVGVSIMPERVMREDMLQGRLMALRLQPAELFRPVRIVHRRRKSLQRCHERNAGTTSGGGGLVQPSSAFYVGLSKIIACEQQWHASNRRDGVRHASPKFRPAGWRPRPNRMNAFTATLRCCSLKATFSTPCLRRNAKYRRASLPCGRSTPLHFQKIVGMPTTTIAAESITSNSR